MITKRLIEEKIDYNKVDMSLKAETDAGLRWLKRALECPHHYESAETLALRKILENDAFMDRQKRPDITGRSLKDGKKFLMKIRRSAGKGARMIKKHGVSDCVRFLKEKGVRKTFLELWRGDD